MEVLTHSQQRVYDALASHFEKYKVAPTYKEIAIAVGASSANGVREALLIIERKGWIELPSNKKRAIKLITTKDMSAELFEKVPVYSEKGEPLGSVKVANALFSPPPEKFIKIQDNSFNFAGAMPGDLVAVIGDIGWGGAKLRQIGLIKGAKITQ